MLISETPNQDKPERSRTFVFRLIIRCERARKIMSGNVDLADTRALRGQLLVSLVAGAVSLRPTGSHCGLGKEPDPGGMGRAGRPP